MLIDLNAIGGIGGQVTVSVVSHGQEEMLNHLLNDMARHASQSLRRVVVTHNLPSVGVQRPEDSREYIFDQVYNKKPRGFGENHNAAFCFCDTEWFAVVNPDIRLGSDIFTELISKAMPNDILLGPALFDPERNEIAPNRGMLNIFEIVGRKFINSAPPKDVVWLPGAFLLLRSGAYKQIGGFDEKFYLYAEDFDLSARMRLAGGVLRYVPDVQVIHPAQHSSHVRLRYLRWHVVSLLKLWTSRTFWRYRNLLRREARAARLKT
ncbi:MAG: glycosyltransferase family 2 protein [Thiomonas sp.]|uniref:glycosyltransferase family 2 protein n=1 Tax=Thiomonas sp. TaxID=2047785 RepID=UPI002A35BF6F|nr:glycosyltransferase family 2 protein [Thiomonas sp.]MDY0330465.1 glycosyltransferase family 2 protein [Thiomonas sp.]